MSIKEQRREDFRTAVGDDCMGWFVARYGWEKLEYEATSPMHLIQLVAARIVEAEKAEKEANK